ncbi:hypothetical protein GH714_032597 [Hevea brasiliensis]|uniref:Uncharacterized protein n=1 Tax=Hevea brasiliensis TaxID=3981 RepID=A0A6A6NBJ8_HEVBR|nr:hypothetical protein GH714_032597 [Hevea brasiliensis]
MQPMWTYGPAGGPTLGAKHFPPPIQTHRLVVWCKLGCRVTLAWVGVEFGTLVREVTYGSLWYLSELRSFTLGASVVAVSLWYKVGSREILGAFEEADLLEEQVPHGFGSYQQNLATYQKLITQFMYDKQLDSGRGTLLHLCDNVIQQEDANGQYSCVDIRSANEVIGTTTEEIVLNVEQQGNDMP